MICWSACVCMCYYTPGSVISWLWYKLFTDCKQYLCEYFSPHQHARAMINSVFWFSEWDAQKDRNRLFDFGNKGSYFNYFRTTLCLLLIGDLVRLRLQRSCRIEQKVVWFFWDLLKAALITRGHVEFSLVTLRIRSKKKVCQSRQPV